MSSHPVPGAAEFPRMLTEARGGGSEALGGLLMQCRNYLLLVANQNLDDDLRAKVSPSDLVQETFLEAQRDFAAFRGDREEELLAWLGRILSNNLANAARRYRATDMRRIDREVPLAGLDSSQHGAWDLSSDSPTPSERLINEENLAAMERALAQLPDHYRQVLRLRYDRQLSFAEVGAGMGCSAEAARKMWARAVAALEQEMNPPNEP
jgi:RNA polymerase sigma-70 factor (ECF subfamily)